MLDNDDALEEVVKEILSNNPQSIKDIQAGKDKAYGFLVRQTMKAMKGKANPEKVNSVIKDLVNEILNNSW